MSFFKSSNSQALLCAIELKSQQVIDIMICYVSLKFLNDEINPNKERWTESTEIKSIKVQSKIQQLSLRIYMYLIRYSIK